MAFGEVITRTRLIGVADQAVSSITNMAITVVAARLLDPRGFGLFVLVMTVYIILVGLVRAVALEPLLIRGVAIEAGLERNAVGATTALGALAGAGCVLIGLATRDATGRSLVVLGVCLPLLFLQEGWRYAAFAHERPEIAILGDAVWLALQAIGTVILLHVGTREPSTVLAMWAVSGSVAAILGAIRARMIPWVPSWRRWVIDNRDLGGPFVAEFLADQGAATATFWVLGILSGLAAVGAVRIGQTVFGPVNVLYIGLYVTLIPEAARRLSEGPSRLQRSMAMASGVLLGMAGLATAMAMWVPAPIGRALFGDSWSNGRSVLLPLGVALCGGAVTAGATAGLRALGRARLSLFVRLWTLPLVVGMPLTGAIAGGEVGFSIGMAGAAWVAAGLWWAAFGMALSKRGADDRRTGLLPDEPFLGQGDRPLRGYCPSASVSDAPPSAPSGSRSGDEHCRDAAL